MTANESSRFGLSAMQVGMLFQAVVGHSDSAYAGYDIEQLHITLDETLDVTKFGQAITSIVGFHENLSASFIWEDRESPQQQINHGLTVPVVLEDWSTLSEREISKKREEFLVRDRELGFDLHVPPLMRVTVFRCPESTTEMIWTVHHILLDGRCFPPLIRQIFSAYDAAVSGNLWVPPLPTRPYRSFIDWLGKQDGSKSLPFFRALLAGKDTPTPLPVAQPAAFPLPLSGYGKKELTVAPVVVAMLDKLAEQTATTFGITLQAALALVLSRFTGEQDILFGVTRSTRRSALDGETAEMIGQFINTLPVRVPLTEDGTVTELLGELQAQNVALRDHEHTSLIDIHGQSDVPRGSPLFETLLMYDNQEINQTLRSSPNRRWQKMHVTVHEQPSFPLNFTVFRGEQLVVRVLYDRRRFEQSAIDRLAASFVVTLERLAVDAHSRLGGVDVLPASERRKIVETWNDTDRVFPDTLRIHQLFEQQVENQPDAIAVEMDGQTLSYRELEERANRLAHALRSRGADTGRYVGICLDRGLNLVVAMLGVAKSGSPYVPLDPSYPAERLTFMVKETEAIAVVTERRFETLFASPVLLLDESEDGDLEGFSVNRPQPIGNSNDVCYTIFTSGSTGTPKGVVLCHKAVVNTLDWVSRNYRVGPGDRLFFVTSPCFDLSVYDTFGALGAGATVVVASSAQLSEPNALAKAITEQRITIWDSAPASLQRLVPFLPSVTSNQSVLRLVMLSGDWIPLALPGSVTTAFPSAEVKSLGGATEAAIWSNHFSIGTIDPRWTSIPYGRPIQNARYHVLDAGLRPLPVGAAGDLYISGVCLAEGYLNQPELTRERFLPNHLSAHSGERLYKTGDRARYMEDGNLEFLGRMDSQIKIRGFRVEIGEVESVIATLPGIQEAICIAHTDASGSKSLVAYVVAVTNVALRPEFVIDALAQRLPGFMVPSQVFVLQAMPLSSNGKIDRNALPNPSTSASRTSFIAPRNYTEDAIASIYAELLKLESVSVTDDFFALGGHSLLAVILITTVKNNLGVELPFSALLEHPTVEAMAEAVIKTASSIKHTTHLVALNRNGALPPIILMPGMGGYAYTFKSLADQLAPNQPVWALQLINEDIDSKLEEISVEAMADIYLDQILAAFPDGPIILGGYSFGALPAFELAHRLIKLGREVPYFISFDGFAPGYPQRLMGLRWIHAHILEFVRTENRKAHLRGRFANIFLRARRLFGIPDPVEENPAFKDPTINDHFNKLRIITRRALQRYKPTCRLDVPFLLFRPEIPFQWMATDLTCPAHGWHQFMGDSITVVTLPGDHLTLFSTGNLTELANTIKRLETNAVVDAQVT